MQYFAWFYFGIALFILPPLDPLVTAGFFRGGVFPLVGHHFGSSGKKTMHPKTFQVQVMAESEKIYQSERN